MDSIRIYLLIAVVVVIVAVIYLINSSGARPAVSEQAVEVTPRAAPTVVTVATSSNETKEIEKAPSLASDGAAAPTPGKSKRYELAKEITTPDGFINTDDQPITIGGLIGKKVILVDFWTYSCINCQRTTPYLNSWYEKYRDQGLEIIGIHTPEFEFEKDYHNVQKAVEKFGIKYPVLLDNDYSTWQAYRNRYWPRKYLIDIDGYIVYDHIGEGQYEETERRIQQALAERAAILGASGSIDQPLTKETTQTDYNSPETYFGAARNASLGNGQPNIAGRQTLNLPAEIKPNVLYLAGDWEFSNEFAENKNAPAKIIFRYRAKNVYLVANATETLKIKILKDGALVKEIAVKAAELYQLIEDSTAGEHTLEIIIGEPGLRAFTFTFG